MILQVYLDVDGEFKGKLQETPRGMVWEAYGRDTLCGGQEWSDFCSFLAEKKTGHGLLMIYEK